MNDDAIIWRRLAITVLIAFCALAFAILVYCPLAHAHDGFDQLSRTDQYGNKFMCCGGHDCGPTQTRYEDTRLQALVTDSKGKPKWVDIPPETILPAHLNPTVGPSVCYNKPSDTIRCFLPGREM